MTYPALPQAIALPTPNQLISGPTCQSLAQLVGNTPVMWTPDVCWRSQRGFWAKLEGHNPGGIKDRVALHLVHRARERGQLAPGAPIIESTSGTLGLGLALAGVVYGHPVTLVTDPGMEPVMRNLLAAYGARVVVVERPHPAGGWQQARRDRVAALAQRHPETFCPDQYHNPDAVEAYQGLALELAGQLGRIDVLICSVGTGGHSAGVSRVLRQFFPHLRLVAVDTVGSTIFGQPARPRLMRGLGSSIYPRNVDYAAFNEVHWVAAAEAVWVCRQLAAARFITGGWSVGAVALVASWLARTLPDDHRIAAIFPDGPARYADTIFNDSYCRRHELLGEPPAPDPDELAHPRQREATRWSRCTAVPDPTDTSGERP